jgi:hypothetical protein
MWDKPTYTLTQIREEKKRTTQRVIIDVYVQIAITKLEGKSNTIILIDSSHPSSGGSV